MFLARDMEAKKIKKKYYRNFHAKISSLCNFEQKTYMYILITNFASIKSFVTLFVLSKIIGAAHLF